VSEVEALTELSLRSKAHWGYDDDFVAACREELTVRPEHVETHRLVVAAPTMTTPPVGFYGLVGTTDDDAELSALFVEPEVIGTGVGRLLFDDAVRVARSIGVRQFRIEADPFAAGFYEHMGAISTGVTPSHSIPGRSLPVYVMDVPAPS
jgi:GNAT superfamily N-acetyltransferase